MISDKVEVGKRYKILGFHKADGFYPKWKKLFRVSPVGCEVIVDLFGIVGHPYVVNETFPGAYEFPAIIVKGNVGWEVGHTVYFYAAYCLEV